MKINELVLYVATWPTPKYCAKTKEQIEDGFIQYTNIYIKFANLKKSVSMLLGICVYIVKSRKHT